jgi:hypothetical protein
MSAKSDASRCTYILPIRRVRANHQEIDELAQYFGQLTEENCEIIVVDGSSAKIFAEHNHAWRGLCRHITVDPNYTYLNGKVNGIHTGVDHASCESIILADDDIRYSSEDIRRACQLLKRYDMVRPQNYLAPLPWWGRTEAARMLINRGVLRSGDYPGTCAFRRSVCLRFGHYDGDVLFDNEEIVRHFILNGGDVCYARDFFILKRPPSLRKGLEQRPRQAYEDFDLRAKTVLFMSLLPAAIALGLLSGARAALAFLLVVSICAGLLAGRGLLLDQAYNFFPAHVILYAPLWVVERSLSVYSALYWRVAHGGYPFGEQLLSKGTGRAWRGARAYMRNPHSLRSPSRQGLRPSRD